MASEVFCDLCHRPMKQQTAKKYPYKKFWGCTGYFPLDARHPDGYDASKGEKQCKGVKFNSGYKQEKIVKVDLPDIILSEQQQAVVDEMAHGTGSIVVMADPGTGKTTVICFGAKHLKGSTLAVAFGNRNSRELESRMPVGIKTGTFHAVGREILKSNLGYVPKLQEFKTYNIVDKYLPEGMEEGKKWFVKFLVKQLVGLCKNRLVFNPHELGSDDEPEITAKLDQLCEQYEIDCGEEAMTVYELTAIALKISAEDKTTIDYDDQLWLPIVHNMKFPKYENLIVDELQDQNEARIEMIFRLCPSGRIIAVGDEKQAIMAFSGSSMDGMQDILKRLEPRGVVTLPLNETRRCPKSHVRAIQHLCPNFKALPDAPEGIIESMNLADALQDIQPGAMIQSRTNAPLAGIVWPLIRRGLKVTVAGKEIGAAFIALIKRMKAKSIPDLIVKVQEYRERELGRIGEKRRNGAQLIANINDKCDCIISFAEGNASVNALVAQIEEIFANVDDAGEVKQGVLLLSSHKAKGLEASDVYILDPTAYPSKLATQPWSIRQEMNLITVAQTRSKNRLVFINVSKDEAK